MFAVKAIARKLRHNENQKSSVNQIKQLREIRTLVVRNRPVTLYQALSTANQQYAGRQIQRRTGALYVPQHIPETHRSQPPQKQKSTGPRTVEARAKSCTNPTSPGFSSLKMNPVAPGCFLHTFNFMKRWVTLSSLGAQAGTQRAKGTIPLLGVHSGKAHAPDGRQSGDCPIAAIPGHPMGEQQSLAGGRHILASNIGPERS